MPIILEANNIVVERNHKEVLNLEHISIEEGELLAVIGPNGAGKSSLLMALSTLLSVSGGTILFRGKPIRRQDQLAYRRQISMVLQDALLLDTTVRENIGTGMRFRGRKESEIKKSVKYWSSQLKIEKLLKRKSRQLSGGEAQRVSLARALAADPKILFLDEPFSALDAPSRSRLISDFQNLQSENRVTTLLVTHDLDEALLLGDRVAVIIAGRVRQIGTPDVVFTQPADLEVAQFVGIDTIIPGVVKQFVDGLSVIEVEGFELEVVANERIGRKVFVILRPEDITLSLQPPTGKTSARNLIHGKIKDLMPQGPLMRVTLGCEFPFVALITRTSAIEMGLASGQILYATFKATTAHLLPRKD